MSDRNRSDIKKTLQRYLQKPVLQAPMAGSQDAALAMAVSDAGGLGALPCAMLSADQVTQALQQVRQKPGRAINVNFFAHTPPKPDPLKAAQWQEMLNPYYAEWGLKPTPEASGGGRQPFDAAYLAAITPFRPEVVSFHFGLPEPELLNAIKAWGGLVASTATTLAEGRWLQEKGADLIIAQGLEAGGHRGHFLPDSADHQYALRVLLPELVSALECPVIAAGGIATPEYVREMLALGACAVQVGTAFLLSPEATTSEVHRRALASEIAQQTRLTNLFSGRPARGIENRLMRELGPLSDRVPAFPLASGALAPLRSAAEAQGCDDFSPLWAGTQAQHCREWPAADVLRWLAGDDAI